MCSGRNQKREYALNYARDAIRCSQSITSVSPLLNLVEKPCMHFYACLNSQCLFTYYGNGWCLRPSHFIVQW